MKEDSITVITDSDDGAVKAAADILRAELVPGDTVLFKASRAVALERIIEALGAGI